MRAPRILGVVLASVALAALLFLFVLPSRTYLAQRHSLAAAETRLKVFSDQNAKLATAVTRLQSDAEIERLAREHYGLVKPGEKAYVIVPSAPVAAPSAPAAKKPAKAGIVHRIWHDIQFWN